MFDYWKDLEGNKEVMICFVTVGGAWIPNKETHLRWHLRSSTSI